MFSGSLVFPANIKVGQLYILDSISTQEKLLRMEVFYNYV